MLNCDLRPLKMYRYYLQMAYRTMRLYTQTDITKVVESSLSDDALVQRTTDASLQNEITKSIFTLNTFFAVSNSAHS